MIQTKSIAHGILLAIVALLNATANAEDATLQVTTQSGWTIYSPTSGSGYRYGPTSIINSDGSIDMWTAGPGTTPNGWDSIYYRHSTDGGKTWSADIIALTPTIGAADNYSTCDPGVVKIGNYYYIGYTSTQNSSGTQNEVYLARSTSPSGGFKKWTGSGWGSNPTSIIKFTGSSSDWGAGEPSFVVKGDTIYAYYSWITSSGWQTRVATASASDDNWAADLTYQGVALSHPSTTSDSLDVKYCDALGKFIGIDVSDRFSATNSIHFWVSDDGLTFTSAETILGDTLSTQNWAHNAGLSGTPDGHLDLSENNFIAYAYSQNDTTSWGDWATYLNPITVVPEPSTAVLLGIAVVLLPGTLALKRAIRR